MFVVYSDAIDRGLIFSEGEIWKKSRSIISNMFHFEMLHNREVIMHSVVDEYTKDLAGQEPDLFQLGCKIGGNIVIESLLGKEFTEIRFGNNTPLEEIQLLIKELIE
jgi:cytochrome P450